MAYNNSKNLNVTGLLFDAHFNQEVDFNISSVHIPVEIYDGGKDSCNTFCIFINITENEEFVV